MKFYLGIENFIMSFYLLPLMVAVRCQDVYDCYSITFHSLECGFQLSGCKFSVQIWVGTNSSLNERKQYNDSYVGQYLLRQFIQKYQINTTKNGICLSKSLQLLYYQFKAQWSLCITPELILIILPYSHKTYIDPTRFE